MKGTASALLSQLKGTGGAGFFGQFGQVKNVRLSRSKKTAKSKGYAWLQFREPDVAPIAAQAMDGYMMYSQKLQVSPAQPRSCLRCPGRAFVVGAGGRRRHEGEKEGMGETGREGGGGGASSVHSSLLPLRLAAAVAMSSWGSCSPSAVTFRLLLNSCGLSAMPYNTALFAVEGNTDPWHVGEALHRNY